MEAFLRDEHSQTLHLNEWEKRFSGLAAGFTMRGGGHSDPPYDSLNLGLHVGDDPVRVRQNRQVLASRLGFPFDAWTCGEQLHGTAVRRVTSTQRGAGRDLLDTAIPAADGLYTDEPGVLLISYYADCVPIYFLDPRSGAVGLAHAGWKGTVGRIAVVMLEELTKSFGTSPDQLLVAIGPAIRACCYEVDERVMERVRGITSGWEESVMPGNEGRYMLDLPQLNVQMLTDCGVLAEHISRSGYCTACRTDLFFSHRRDGGKTGRMASYIGWREEGAIKQG
ncbi:MAG: peptidoglycan editing factor PgeF [Brevibacillus sp.]|nr:peptidoglycan editing factor PgeF [Brevibacillus sp.]